MVLTETVFTLLQTLMSAPATHARTGELVKTTQMSSYVHVCLICTEEVYAKLVS